MTSAERQLTSTERLLASGERGGGAASKRLSAWLVFAVVYADIGTSVFYVPGILYLSIGNLAALAQVLTLGVFIAIARKYAEISHRCPDGGGVVSICAQAFPTLPWLALVGGSLITIDYFLTSAISGVSAIYYLNSLLGIDDALGVPKASLAVAVASACLLGLLWLNVIGLKESASVTASIAVLKLVTATLLILLSAFHITAAGRWGELFELLSDPGAGKKLTATMLLIGYAETWLAYSGLESGAQVSGAMAPPVDRTASRAMWGVIGAISVISPTLTAFCLFRLSPEVKTAEPEAFISALAATEGGIALKVLAVISATLLLVMACNTAIVGNYHVNSRLVAAGFLPPALGSRNRRYGTPHWSIAVSALVPIAVIFATGGRVDKLGDLYSFGLLGTLALSSVSIDVLRWREHGTPFAFLTGSITTMALGLAWSINLVHKPAALVFGGGLTVLFVGAGLLVRGGWLGKALGPEARAATLREAEELGAAAPEAAKVLTLSEAVDLRPLERSKIIVALRGLNERLLEDAATFAKGSGERAVYVVYVDEVPGLFLPTDVAPSDEAQNVLHRAYEILEKRHQILALPIWRLASDTPLAIAEAAQELGATAVFVGTTKRGAIWHLMRGNVLKGLLKALPQETRLLIAS